MAPPQETGDFEMVGGDTENGVAFPPEGSFREPSKETSDVGRTVLSELAANEPHEVFGFTD